LVASRIRTLLHECDWQVPKRCLRKTRTVRMRVRRSPRN
jgi:hypothetical protein